jgi:hypothetical protein
MLTALRCEEPDRIPCCFMIFSALRERCKDQIEFIERQLEMGLDVRVELPELPFRFHPDVEVRTWKEEVPDHPYPLLRREYVTPAGTLTAEVWRTPDWPYGDDVPLFDDYLIPRSRKFLVTDEKDLEPLGFLFADPTDEDITWFRERAKVLKEFASKRGLLVSGGWEPTSGDGGCMGIDGLMWLCGIKEAVLTSIDRPELFEELVGIVHRWNLKRMEIVLEEGVDLIVKRAWYESTDFWSPGLYRRYMFPPLQKEVELTHQAGAKFGYIITSGFMPILDQIIEAGVDVLIGVDPVQGKGVELEPLKERSRGKLCLWGGVNGFLTIELGSTQQVEEETRKAIELLGPDGFILSPVDNVREDSKRAWENVMTMIRTAGISPDPDGR